MKYVSRFSIDYDAAIKSVSLNGKTKKSKDTISAWIAGFVDGEGYMGISRQIRRRRPSPAFRVAIVISNNKLKPLLFIRSLYGGSIYYLHDRRKNDKRRDRLKYWTVSYDWHCPQSAQKKFLEDIEPYLMIKQEQTHLLLYFLKHKKIIEDLFLIPDMDLHHYLKKKSNFVKDYGTNLAF